MKITLFAIIFSIFLAISVRAQERQTAAIDALQTQVSGALAQGKLDDAITAAEKIAKLEKEARPRDPKRIATALHNLALWKDQRLMRIMGQRVNRREFLDEVEEVVKLFRELLKLAEENGEPVALAQAQSELGSFLYKAGDRPWAEIEALFLSSLRLREKHYGAEAKQPLALVSKLSEIYFFRGEYEQFYPMNRRLAVLTARDSGENSRAMLPVLKLYAEYLLATDREKEAADITKQIALIAGNTDFAPTLKRNGVGRATTDIDAFFGKSASISTSGISGDSRVFNTSGGGRVIGETLGTTGSVVNLPMRQRIEIDLLVDENGRVIETRPVGNLLLDTKTLDRIDERSKTWRFLPYSEQGIPRRLRIRIRIIV